MTTTEALTKVMKLTSKRLLKKANKKTNAAKKLTELAAKNSKRSETELKRAVKLDKLISSIDD